MQHPSDCVPAVGSQSAVGPGCNSLPPVCREYAANLARWFPEVLLALGAPDLDDQLCMRTSVPKVDHYATGTSIEVSIPPRREIHATPATGPAARQAALDSLESMACDFEGYAAALARSTRLPVSPPAAVAPSVQAWLPEASSRQAATKGPEASTMEARLDRATDKIAALTACVKWAVEAAPAQQPLPIPQQIPAATAAAMAPLGILRGQQPERMSTHRAAATSERLLGQVRFSGQRISGAIPSTTEKPCRGNAVAAIAAANAVAASAKAVTRRMNANPSGYSNYGASEDLVPLTGQVRDMGKDPTPRRGQARQVRQREPDNNTPLGRCRTLPTRLTTSRNLPQDLSILITKLQKLPQQEPMSPKLAKPPLVWGPSSRPRSPGVHQEDRTTSAIKARIEESLMGVFGETQSRENHSMRQQRSLPLFSQTKKRVTV
mmetsp:Transcript_29873/g.82004  ORF Transcript_29873/g.82004 Transcript_29873/m.82004 type:complete len:435 (-) Transcript_29873:87-1391(-)